jgi:hypothetical protein
VHNFVETGGFAICGLAYLRNFRICDSEMSPWICGFADFKKFACPPLLKSQMLFYLFHLGITNKNLKLFFGPRDWPDRTDSIHLAH